MGRKLLFWLFILALLAASWGGYSIYIYMERRAVPPGGVPPKTAAEEEDKGMEGREMGAVAELKLQYLGHAAFLLGAGETRFLLDPYDPNCGYGKLDVDAHYITISHEHMDHNYIAAAPGARPIRGLSPDGLGWEDVSLTLGEVEVFTVPTYHDGAAGKLRGRNAVFVFDAGGLRLVHLGDLGHLLNPEQVEKLSPVDVLLLPVGGHFTISGAEAKELIDVLAPAVAVPMHYRTEATRNWPISPLEDFLKAVDKPVREKKDLPLILNKNTLPRETEIWILKADAAVRKK